MKARAHALAPRDTQLLVLKFTHLSLEQNLRERLIYTGSAQLKYLYVFSGGGVVLYDFIVRKLVILLSFLSVHTFYREYVFFYEKL